MRVFDISIKLDENTEIYEGDPRFSCEVWRSIGEDGYMLSKLRMGSHTGTHADAPCHFIEGGKTMMDIPLKRFVGRCLVVSSIDDIEPGFSRVLLRGNGLSGRLTPETAQRLVDAGVKLVGTERLSIGNDAVHRILLGSECVILEAIDLRKVKDGRYILSAAPLKIEADGSPIRACLIEPD